MATRNMYKEIKSVKLKDLPSKLKPMMSIDYAKKAINASMDAYYDNYIKTSSVTPLYHVCFGLMFISYLVALPKERRSLEEHHRTHGGSGSGH